MESRLKILFLSSEVAPFSGTGGLGEVSAALPRSLKNLGHEVRVVTPRYRSTRERRFGLREVARLRSMLIDIAGKGHACSVRSGFIPRSKAQIYFLESRDMYDRVGNYVNPETGKDWSDNHIRFAFLNHAALQLVIHLDWIPDVIHCNDWQTALAPYLIRTNKRYIEAFENTRTLLHIHNLAFHGIFSREQAREIGFNSGELEPGQPLAYFEQAGFLKAGILTADLLATVSPTYAREIQSSGEFGFGLQGELSERSINLHGILNGIDTDAWNPTTDAKIPRRYSIDDYVEGKAFNKVVLQAKLRLKRDITIPIIGMVARLTEQKGYELFAAGEEDILALNAQFVFLGTESGPFNDLLKRWSEQHPDRISFTYGFDDDLAHLIEAGADIYLMPSKYEPCGLNQMYSLSYGTLPVVRRTGGLADSVIDYSQNPDSGNGFAFDEFSGPAMLDALRRALDLYTNRDIWRVIQQRGLQSDFAWESSAQRIVGLYEEMLGQVPFMNGYRKVKVVAGR